jgi:hypothetical protein
MAMSTLKAISGLALIMETRVGQRLLTSTIGVIFSYGVWTSGAGKVGEGHPSNAPKTKHHDQITCIAPDLEDRLQPSEAGVFDFYEHVYRTDDEPLYAGEMGENYLRKDDSTERTERGRTTYYRTYWRTHQMSDHLPMWISLKTDSGEEFLERKAGMES